MAILLHSFCLIKNRWFRRVLCLITINLNYDILCTPYIINRVQAIYCYVTTFGYGRFLLSAMLVIFATVILSCMINFDRSMDFMAAATKNSQANTFATLTDQMALQERNISSTQAGDITVIKNSMSEQVQLLRNMTQAVARSSTQASFAALCVFLWV
jgi:hypothetical protein